MAANVQSSAVIEFAASVAGLRRDMQEAARIAERNFGKIEKSALKLRDAFAGITAGLAFGKVLKIADEYNVLQARIQSATKSTKDYAAVSNELFKITQKTGASLKDSVDVFQRLSLAAGSLGASNKDMLMLTATVQKLGVMGGASTTALNAGLLQFGQLMGSGVAHAEELNSIIENMPLVADKIAKGMNMTVSEMRNAAKQGKVLSSQVFESLMKQAPEIQKEFEKMPASLGRSFNALKEAFAKSIGELDKSLGITSGLAKGLDMISKHADLATNAVVGLGAGAAVFKLFSFDVKAASTAVRALTMALAANPWGLALTGIAAATAALITFKDTTFNIGKHQVTLSTLIAASWEKIWPVITAGWQSVKGAASAAMTWIGSKWHELNVWFIKTLGSTIVKFQSAFQWLTKLPVIGEPIKQAFAAVSGGVDALGKHAANIGKFVADQTDGIAARAAEMLATQKKIGEVSDKPLGKPKAPVDEKMQKLLEKQAKAKEKFFRMQQATNEALRIEVEEGKKAAELAELTAQFRERVGRQILPQELSQLQEILKVRNQLKALEAFKDAERGLQDELGLLELKRKDLEELIPFQRMMNDFKKDEIELTKEQQDRLKELSVAQFKGEAAEKTREYIKNLDEEISKLRDELTVGKENADVLEALRKAKEENKFITEGELTVIREKLELTKQINKEIKEQKAIKEFFKEQQKGNKQLELSLIQNKEIRNILEAQESLRQKLGRDLTAEEASQAAIGAKQKSYLEDAKRALDLHKENLTEQEKFKEALEEANRLYSQGLISFEDYTRALKKASPEFQKIKDFAKETAGAFTTALDDILFKSKSIKESFKDMAKTMVRNLTKRLLYDPLEKGIENFITGMWRPPVPGGSSSGGINGLFGGLGKLFGVGGGGGSSVPSPFPSVTNNASGKAGAVYANGPVFINGAQVAMNQPAISAPLGGPVGGNYNFSGGGGGGLTGPGGLLGGAQNLIGGLFSSLSNMLNNLVSGIKGIFSNGISGLFSSVMKLFSGGLGGLFGGDKGGGIGSLFGGLGGLLNIPQALKVAFQPASGLMGGLKGLGGLLNIPQALKVAFQPAQGLMSGIGSLGGLLNFPKAISTAFAPLFGGGRALGGSVGGGQMYLTGERGPELFFPGASGAVMPTGESQAFAAGMQAGMSQQQKSAMINGGLLGGTPSYKSQPGSYWGGEWQAQQAFDKIQYWQSLSPIEKARLQASEPWRMPSTADTYSIAQGRDRLWKDGLEKELRNAYNQFSILEGQAMVDSSISGQGFNARGNIGEEFIRRGKGGFFDSTFNGVGDRRGGFGLADGNQNGNLLNKLRMMGVPISDRLLEFANTGDQIWDVVNPSGILPPLLALGSREGMGGTGSGAYGRGGAAYYDNNNPFAAGRGRYTRIGPMPAPGFTPPGTPGRGDYTPPSAGSPFRNNPGGQIWGPGAPGMGRNAQTNGRYYAGDNGDVRLPGYQFTDPGNKLKSVEDVLRHQQFIRDMWMPGPIPLEMAPTMDITGGAQAGGVRGIDSGRWGFAASDVFQKQTPVMTTGRAQLYNPGLANFLPPNLATGFRTGVMDALMGMGVRGFARGGRPAAGKASIVGERGPELFVPDTAGKIMPNGSFGGDPVTVNITTNTAMPLDVRRTVSGDGRSVEIAIDDIIAAQIQRGGRTSRAVARASRARVGRG